MRILSLVNIILCIHKLMETKKWKQRKSKKRELRRVKVEERRGMKKRQNTFPRKRAVLTVFHSFFFV